MVLKKYNTSFYQCTECGFIQSDAPFWIEESYKNPINKSDTGLVQRNLEYSKIAAVVLFYLYDAKGIFLDYAGGYGLFTRLMRDIGFDYYWHDQYTANILARGFEYKDSIGKVELITSFESMEHFVEPVHEFEKMHTITGNILFSTELLPNPVPQPGEWWYYSFEHGQHISFYTKKSLMRLANIFGMNYYSCGPLHLITSKTMNQNKLNLLVGFHPFFFRWGVQRNLQRKTEDDSEMMKHDN